MHPSHTNPALRHQNDGIWLPCCQQNREISKRRKRMPVRKAGRSVKYACRKLQTRLAAVKAESSPRLAVTLIPIISAVSHPMPDTYTRLRMPDPINMSHVSMSSGENMSQRTGICNKFKGSSNFKYACLHPNLGKRNITRQ